MNTFSPAGRVERAGSRVRPIGRISSGAPHLLQRRRRRGSLWLETGLPLLIYCAVVAIVGWDKAAVAAAGPPRAVSIGGPALAYASLSHPTC